MDSHTVKLNALDRIMYSVLIWVETIAICGYMIYAKSCNLAPTDLNMDMFLSITMTLFFMGHLIEWYYHIFMNPFSSEREHYKPKKKTLKILFVMVVISIASAILVFVEFSTQIVFGMLIILSSMIVIIFLCSNFNQCIKNYCTAKTSTTDKSKTHRHV